MTVLEVARASADKERNEEGEEWSDDYEPSYHIVHDGDGVIKLLSTYMQEPPSHPASLMFECAEHVFL